MRVGNLPELLALPTLLAAGRAKGYSKFAAISAKPFARASNDVTP
jgi:hypothetical protein